MPFDWETIYVSQYRRLVVLMTALTNSQTEAEDVVQEAFSRALSARGPKAAHDDPVAWLYIVARNLAYSRRRRVVVAIRNSAALAPVFRSTQFEDVTIDRLELLRRLRALPLTQREALALYYFEDLSTSDIAARLRVPEGTVKARLSRGREALSTPESIDKLSNGEESI